MKIILKKTIVLVLLIATFCAIASCANHDTFAITYTTSEGGFIDGYDSQTVKKGKNGSEVTAKAYDGYIFTGWSDGEKVTTRQEKNVQSNLTLTANFICKTDNNTIQISYTTDGNGTIEGKANQTIPFGANAETVIAKAHDGYEFEEWSDGVTTAERVDTNLTDPKAVIARFRCVFEEGFGTTECPFLINDYEQFLKINLYPNYEYKLINNLDLSSKNHEPLFDSENNFSGVFDGNDYTINNMTVDTYTALPSLFGYIGPKGVIKNLNIVNSTIIVPNYDTSTELLCVGTVAGISYGIFENINASGVISGDGLYYDGISIGGIAGYAANSIINCHVNIQINLDDIKSNETEMLNPFCFGGLVGVSSANICESSTAGSISVKQAVFGVLVGGFIGYYFCDDPLVNISIHQSLSNININSDLHITSAGFIANINPLVGTVEIENCFSKGNITGGQGAAGFIYKCYAGLLDDKTRIKNCNAQFDISVNGQAAGFIKELYNAEVVDCYFNGDIISNGYAIGFCYSANNVEFYHCYSRGVITALNTFGFIYELNESNIDECFSEVTVYAELRGVGFIFSAAQGSAITNCYSQSDVIVTNTDPLNSGRTLVAGFVFAIYNSKMSNCYYSGNVYGSGVITNPPIGGQSMVASFVGITKDSTIKNGHLLIYENTMATDIVCDNRSPEFLIDITVYDEPEQLYFLAEVLDADSNKMVWINCESAFPQLYFV